MPVNANYLCSLGLAWLPPNSAYWRLEADVSLAVASITEKGIPQRDELSRSYSTLIANEVGGWKVKAPIQSLYEPWTTDPDCRLAFARSRGLRRGDAALHMDYVLSSLGLEVPAALNLDSDHVAIILNAASVIAEQFPDRLGDFVNNHLSWLRGYKRKAEQTWPDEPHADFYLALLEETIRVSSLISAGGISRTLRSA